MAKQTRQKQPTNLQAKDRSQIPIRCKFHKLAAPRTLRAHPQNQNKHPESQLVDYEAIVREQGWRTPIRVSRLTGFVTKGHGALEVAKRMGLKQVPVEFQEYPSEAHEIGDMVADNMLARRSEVDWEGTRQLLEGLPKDFNTALTGISPGDIANLLAATFSPNKPGEATGSETSKTVAFKGASASILDRFLHKRREDALGKTDAEYVAELMEAWLRNPKAMPL